MSHLEVSRSQAATQLFTLKRHQHEINFISPRQMMFGVFVFGLGVLFCFVCFFPKDHDSQNSPANLLSGWQEDLLPEFLFLLFFKFLVSLPLLLYFYDVFMFISMPWGETQAIWLFKIATVKLNSAASVMGERGTYLQCWRCKLGKMLFIFIFNLEWSYVWLQTFLHLDCGSFQ